MLKRVGLYSSIIVCLGWIIFAISTLVEPNKNHSYLNYFSSEDEAIIAIHHPRDFNLSEIGINSNSNILNVYASLRTTLPEPASVYLSKKRNLLVIELKEKWSHALVKRVFSKGIFPLKKKTFHAFQFGKYLGEFKGKQLVLKYYDLKINPVHSLSWEVDAQSSFSIVNLVGKPWVSDSYCKLDRRITYITEPYQKKKVEQIDDRALFSEFIPSNISFYSFYEKEYLMHTDHEFDKSQLSNIILSGIVFLEVDEIPIAIFDVKDAELLIPSLNEYFHLEEHNEDNGEFPVFKVSSHFKLPNETQAIYAKEFEGFGIISTNRHAIDDLLAEISLKKTISTNALKYELFNKELPQKVSHRSITKSRHKSCSWINGKLLSVQVDKEGLESIGDDAQESKNYFTMNPGEEVLSFCALAGRGNVILATEKNIYGYKNGSQKWKQELESSLLFPPKILDYKKEEREDIILQFDDKIVIIDKMGRENVSFASKYDLPIEQALVKNKPILVCAKTKELVLVNTTGNAIKRIPFTDPIESLKIAYKNGNAFCGVITTTSVYKVDLNSGQKIKCKIPTDQILAFTSDGKWIANSNGKIIELEGNNTKSTEISGAWKYVDNINIDKTQGLLFYKGESLVLLINGKVKWKSKIPVQEISGVKIFQNKNGDPLIYIFDAIENRVYLYTQKGKLLDQEDRPAYKEVQASSFGNNGYSITTFLGNFLIQFNR